MSKVVGILLKSNKVDSLGVKQWLYVTKDKFDKMMESQLDPEMRGFRWAVKDVTFTMADIAETKEMDDEYARTLPTWGKYIEEKVQEQKLLEAKQQESLNPEGLKKLEELKAKFSLNKGVDDK